jgi:phage baseplate assembly protein W
MSRILSDYNDTLSSNVARNRVYSDLNPSFMVHPVLKDLIPLNDIDAIKNSIKNIILTNTLDRPFHPEISSGLRLLLFEQADIFINYEIGEKIRNIILLLEPRIENLEIDVIDNSVSNQYKVTITFSTFYDKSEELIIYLTRLR